MEKVIRYLYNETKQRNYTFRHSNTLLFAFDNFKISITYNFFNGEKRKDVEAIAELLKDISNINFKQFFISISESFNDKLYFDGSNVNEKKIYIPERSNSISNSMFNLVNQLTKLNKNLVLNHKVKVEYPIDEAMCGYYPQYTGEIEIDIKKIDSEILGKIITDLKSYTPVELDKLYVPAYYNYKRSTNSCTPQFLNTNTKVRRLGYLKLFFKFINEKKKIPQSFVDKKFEEFSLQFSSQLNDISNNKGVIQNLGGKSAEPYISLLKEMDLITTVNRVVVPTKWLKTYLVLRENFIDKNSEAFILDKVDKIFFMETILRKDFFYTIVILEFLCVRETCTAHEIINNFQKLLLQRIEKLLNQSAYKDEKGVSQLKEIQKRVMAWKKADVYLEHIIMPRVNWYADLDIIKLNNNKITVNENGKRLFSELNSWIDIAAEYVADSTGFLKMYYPHVYAKSYFGSYGTHPNKEIIYELVDQFINESFVLFKTLAPNRVTSSQAFTFAKYSLFFKNGFSVSESYLARIVEEKFSNKYIYKFQPRYGDGYIQKIQSK